MLSKKCCTFAQMLLLLRYYQSMDSFAALLMENHV